MIKLDKLPEPHVLQTEGPGWLKVLQDKIAAGEIPTYTERSRYRHPEIKTVLKLETHGKCAYCESYLLHIAFGDVEHISPKSLRIEDTFKWTKLTLACDVCNTYKGNNANIVDPYVEDPADYFNFLGPMIYAKPGLAKALVTKTKLRLNRAELIGERVKRLDKISSILLTLNNTQDATIRDAITEDLLVNEAADDGEYAAFVRSFLVTVVPDLFKERNCEVVSVACDTNSV